MSIKDETIRWPTKLDHREIVVRLVNFREVAVSNDLADLAARFTDVETMPAAKIGAHVVAAITWLQDKPEYRSLVSQLEMVAMNLKNLK